MVVSVLFFFFIRQLQGNLWENLPRNSGPKHYLGRKKGKIRKEHHPHFLSEFSASGAKSALPPNNPK